MSDGSFPRSVLLLAGLLVVRCTCGSAADETAQPPSAPKAAGARLVLSPSALGGSPLYQSWPLMLHVTLWREPPQEDAPTPQPITIKAKQGAWCEALVVTIRDAAKAEVKWPLHLVKRDEPQLALGADGGATVEWWLAPEETKALPEGDYTITVAFDPQKVDGLPTDADAPRGDTYRLHVSKEPAPLDADTTANKLCQQAWFCMVRDDKAGANEALAKLMAADPQSIEGRRLKALLLAREGKVPEGLALLDEAIQLYVTKHPKASPPFGLLALRRQLRALMPKPKVIQQ